MDWKLHFKRWIEHENLYEDLKEELQGIHTNEKQLEECFYKNLEFGTGGMRGEIGPGTNRMNVYTIRKATEGLARYMEEEGEDAKKRGVVIAYDVRRKSPEFALEAALTLGKHGIPAYLFDECRPTPVLSFAVRYLKAYMGIVITASHNPPEYNGYKVYGPDGGQLPPDMADVVIDRVDQVENELLVEVSTEEELKNLNLLHIVGEEIDQAYLKEIQQLPINRELIDQMADQLKIVYTPLHGTGSKLVPESLRKVGFNQVTVVAEQKEADANFTTVKSPNPEEHAAFALAIEYGNRLNADLLLATDPDADRVGAAVKNPSGEYEILTGNQTGAILLHYILMMRSNQGTMPENGAIIKTIVTSDMGSVIASHFGLETMETLTGFKFIGEKIKEFEETGSHTYLFGYEESYGYLIKEFARDKDAVQSCVMIAEVAAYYKSRGMTLYEGLHELYQQYGCFLEGLQSMTLKGKEGLAQISAILSYFRNEPPMEVAGEKVSIIEDYQVSRRYLLAENKEAALTLPVSNVLKYILANGSWFCLRPSGTEPKIKIYFGVQEKTYEESKELLSRLKNEVMERITSFLG